MSLFTRSSSAVQNATPEAIFVDPFGANPVDRDAALAALEVSMSSGGVFTAVSEIVEALRPISAIEVLSGALIDQYELDRSDPSGRLDAINCFVELVIPSKVVDAAEAQIAANMRPLGYSRWLLSGFEGEERHELAAKHGVAILGELVTASYVAACTPDVREGFAQQFEAYRL